MSWTDTEWEAFCALLDEAWPGEFDDAAAGAWRALLAGVEPRAAIEALKRLLLEGRRFRPSASELLAAVRADPTRPTFDEALVLIGRALRADVTGTFKSPASERCARNALALEHAAAAHSLIGAFLQRQGVERLRGLPLSDPTWGEKTRRELREAWDRHIEAFDGREVAALASGRPDELRQLDPLASLDVPARALPSGSERA